MDRANFLIRNESELQHRISMRLLPQRFKHLWTAQEGAALKIPNVWLVPVQIKHKIDWYGNEAAQAFVPIVNGYFTLDKIFVDGKREPYYVLWLQNLKEVLGAMNGD